MLDAQLLALLNQQSRMRIHIIHDFPYLCPSQSGDHITSHHLLDTSGQGIQREVGGTPPAGSLGFPAEEERRRMGFSSTGFMRSFTCTWMLPDREPCERTVLLSAECSE